MNKAFTLLIVLLLWQNPDRAYASDYKDMWWNPRLSGMGLNISQIGNTLFGAWYHYTDNGQPTFLTFAGIPENNVLNTPLYRSTGAAPGPDYDPARVQTRAVGNVQLLFNPLTPNQIRFQYNFEGKQGTIELERFSFADSSASLRYPFEGMVYGTRDRPGEFALFDFTLNNQQFQLKQTTSQTECEYRGQYLPASDAVNAYGSFSCSDGLTGTFTAPRLRVTAEGVYVGQIMRTDSQGRQDTQTHAGIRRENNGMLDLTGRTLASETKHSKCSNVDFRTRFNLTFASETVTFSGSDRVITDSSSSDPNFCTSGPAVTELLYYAALRIEEPDDPFVQCMPRCNVSTLNQRWSGIDPDNRRYNGSVQHTPGSKIIVTTKQITYDPRVPTKTDWGTATTIYVIQ